MSVNKVLLLGRLGKDPVSRTTTNQNVVVSFPLATGDRRKNASGQVVENTEWHNIVAFGKTAELCGKYLQKGREVYIEGRLQTRKWQDQSGSDRYTTEIVASTVEFLGGKRDDAAGQSSPESSAGASADSVSNFLEDDMPF